MWNVQAEKNKDEVSFCCCHTSKARNILLYSVSFLLQSGLVLADTPGIGENDYLEQYLMDYIATHEILGFVYIIFSDDGGGVKEDRVGFKLL